LRRSNLRNWESRIVESLRKPQSRIALALYLLLFPVNIFVATKIVESPAQLVGFTVCLILMVVGAYGRFRAARALARAGRLRAALGADVLGTWLFFVAPFVGIPLLRTQTVESADVLLYTGFLVVGLFLIAHLWPKLNGQRV
jgi:hypothetical protein